MGILTDLHELVSHNVIGEKQLRPRYLGFRAELDSKSILCTYYSKVLSGGYIISLDSSESSLNNSIYFTCVPNMADISDYQKVYIELKKLNFKTMYLLIYSEPFEDKEVMIFEDKKVSLKCPSFKVMSFNYEENLFEVCDDLEVFISEFEKVSVRGRNTFPIGVDYQRMLISSLNHYEKSDLIQLYVERLVFDGFLGFSIKKGKPSDIDAIGILDDGTIELIEIKEKDLPKVNRKGFGLDTPRIRDFQQIEKLTGLNYRLFVRHVNNQKDRKLLNWLCIAISDFVEDVVGESEVEGGTGMRSQYSKNPTKICSFEKFTIVEEKND
ncbi:hypothetical protein [Halobacteriovorax sp. RT-2-4]|uniref:hypothetical protein n=1 Tax=unclassified Halobacteriovorax TaxID=2639665 RepID=UPI003999A1AC